MAGRGKIEVTTAQLDSASAKVKGFATDYEKEFGALYATIEELKNAWGGTDNQQYTDQIDGFKGDFQDMKTLMDRYADYVKTSADTYRRTQEQIKSDATKLRMDA